MQWQFKRLLDHRARNVGLNAPDSVGESQVLIQESSIVFEIAAYDPQQGIALAEHQIALEHLRQRRHCSGELLGGDPVSGQQRDPCKECARQAHFGRG